MRNFIWRWLVNAVAIAVTARLLPGIQVGGNPWVTVLSVALIFGLVNAVIKPIFSFLTCGLYILSLGLFTFVANAVMLLATETLSQWLGLSFRVNGFWTALLGALVISAISFMLSLMVGKKEHRGKSAH